MAYRANYLHPLIHPGPELAARCRSRGRGIQSLRRIIPSIGVYWAQRRRCRSPVHIDSRRASPKPGLIRPDQTVRSIPSDFRSAGLEQERFEDAGGRSGHDRDHIRVAGGRLEDHLRLEEVDPPKRIAWSGATLGIRAMHVWDLAEEGQGTRRPHGGILRRVGPEAPSRFHRKTLAESLARHRGPRGRGRVVGPAFLGPRQQGRRRFGSRTASP